MKNLLLFILSLAIGCTVTAAPSRHNKKRHKTPQVVSVSMRRTACYGRCPDYTIEINSDGTVTYTGRRFTADTGTFKKNIGVQKAAEVLSRFYTYQVDTCSDLYKSRASDLPGVILTIQYTTHTKEILNANFGPPFLNQLATAIDNAGNKTDSEGWQKQTTTAK